jgi:preprotein translocase subunit Sec63
MSAKLGSSSGAKADLAIPAAAFSSVFFLISVACLYVYSRKPAATATGSESSEDKSVTQTKKSKGFLFSFCSILAVVSALVFAVSINVANSDTSLNAYEPYRVLEIAKDSPVTDVQQAYRKLSRKHHPDKGGDPELFRQVARAYKALTDPVAMKNMREFGNPEGDKSGSRFGIPSWLRGGEDGTNKALLAGYLLLIIVGAAIPLYFYSRKGSDGNEDETDEADVKVDLKTQQRLARMAQLEAAEEREKRKEEKRLLKKGGKKE